MGGAAIKNRRNPGGHKCRKLSQHPSDLDYLPMYTRGQSDKGSLSTMNHSTDANITHHDGIGYHPLGAACPVEDCGLSDKAGVCNRYLEDDSILFHCLAHGDFAISLYDPQQAARLELNTPMRNLLRNRLFGTDPAAHWIQVIGADYAGFYQEQLLWQPLAAADMPLEKLPLIVYSPQILDWSGAKISKSLYVEPSAYSYLRGTNLEYMLGYHLLPASGFTLEHIYRVCYHWIDR